MSLNTLIAFQVGSQAKPSEYLDRYVSDMFFWYEGNYGLTQTSWKEASGNGVDLSRFDAGEVNFIDTLNSLNVCEIRAGSAAGWQYTNPDYSQTVMTNGYTYTILVNIGTLGGSPVATDLLQFGNLNHCLYSDVSVGTRPTFYRNSTGNGFIQYTGYTEGDWLLLTLYGTGVNDLNMYANGNTGTLASTTSSGSTLDTSSPTFVHNSINTEQLKIAEMIAFNNNIGLTKREETEGYLAHKWGVTSLLPGGHPYKSSAPS